MLNKKQKQFLKVKASDFWDRRVKERLKFSIFWCIFCDASSSKSPFLIRSLLSPRVIDFALLLTQKKSGDEEATGLLARCYTTKTSKKQMKEPWKFKREILNQQKNKNNNGETKDKRRYNNCFFPSSTYNYYVKKFQMYCECPTYNKW